ncbi:MAG: hypothetical protein FWC09_03090 [Lachnospiraceae bacterium]|nr:hypothetical protein [Lachnospiraceae bacterium]
MFSYDDYKEIITQIKATGLNTTYQKALNRERFIIMRHDVEFSVSRAYALSRIEDNLDFTANYFFQWTNNSYNILSRRNMDMIKDMQERGHHIGLHFALNGLTDLKLIRKQIIKEMNILSEMFGFEINQFSIHRPGQSILQANIKFPGIINAYQDDFFTYSENTAAESQLKIKYLSDSNHIWRYGYPDEKTLNNHNKIQVLTHPFAWTKKGYDNFDNYKTLVQEKYIEMIDSIDNECKDFRDYKDHFLTDCTTNS